MINLYTCGLGGILADDMGMGKIVGTQLDLQPLKFLLMLFTHLFVFTQLVLQP